MLRKHVRKNGAQQRRSRRGAKKHAMFNVTPACPAAAPPSPTAGFIATDAHSLMAIMADAQREARCRENIGVHRRDALRRCRERGGAAARGRVNDHDTAPTVHRFACKRKGAAPVRVRKNMRRQQKERKRACGAQQSATVRSNISQQKTAVYARRTTIQHRSPQPNVSAAPPPADAAR
jgi:hypothetical protein